MFICYDNRPGKWGGGAGGVVMQERRKELLEKYPCGIERGWDLVQKWGLALVEVTQSHRNKAWYHSTPFTISPRKQKHPERDLAPQFLHWLWRIEERRRDERVVENGRGNGQGHRMTAGSITGPWELIMIRNLE